MAADPSSTGFRWLGDESSEWALVAEELGGLPHALQFRRPLMKAAGKYVAGLTLITRMSAEQRNSLVKVHDHVRALRQLLAEHAAWISAEVDFFGEAHELFDLSSEGPLPRLDGLILEYLAERTPDRGSPGKRARREFWTAAAIIYERATGRGVGISTMDGNPCGPFVRYLMALSGPLMPTEPPTAHMVDEFSTWYRTAKGNNSPGYWGIVPLVTE